MAQNSNLALMDPSNMPGLEPPPGVIPNLVNPKDELFTWWILMMCMCSISSTIFVFVRMYTKLALVKSHGWEDYTSFMAWLGLMGYLAIDFVAFSHGAGVHQWNVRLSDVEVFAQAVSAKEIGFAPVIYITKLSILIQFLRIFVPRKTGLAYYSIHFVNLINLMYYAAYFLVTIFMCTPRRKIWQPWISGHCVNINDVIISAAIINVSSDIAMLLIPLFCISKLRMPTRRKTGIGAVFAVGVFVCFTSVMRLVVSFQIAHATDKTYHLIPLAFWADAEITSAIICGCLPVLPAFFRFFMPKLRMSFDSIRQGKTQSSELSRQSISQPKASISLFPSKEPRHFVAPWEDPCLDPHLVKGNYLELGQQNTTELALNLAAEEIQVRAKKLSSLRNSQRLANPDLETGTHASGKG